MQLSGIHHLTAITAKARANYLFYTDVLGMRLVKKTVNQDDVSAYHLFYADGRGSPGTDLTFFDWPATPEQRGTHSIVRTGLRVAGEAALKWWLQRFRNCDVHHDEIINRDERLTLDFEDPEGQRFSLVDDAARGDAYPWAKSSGAPRVPDPGSWTDHVEYSEAGIYRKNSSEASKYASIRRHEADDGSAVHVYEMGRGRSLRLSCTSPFSPIFHSPGRELGACTTWRYAQHSAITKRG